MEIKRAIRQMQRQKELCASNDGDDYEIEAFDIAIVALEKQIPQKLTKEQGFFYCCPTCDIELCEYVENYFNCFNCGQKLDWED